jgi:hypothetical protein
MPGDVVLITRLHALASTSKVTATPPACSYVLQSQLKACWPSATAADCLTVAQLTCDERKHTERTTCTNQVLNDSNFSAFTIGNGLSPTVMVRTHQYCLCGLADHWRENCTAANVWYSATCKPCEPASLA